MVAGNPPCWDPHVIPAFRRLRQKDHKFKASLDYIVRCCLKSKKKKREEEDKEEEENAEEGTCRHLASL
jgi:hypothetical protein